MKMPKAFQTWTKRWEDGTTSRFLAVPQDSNVYIIDEDGHSFGSWTSVKSFKAHQKKNQAGSLSGRYALNTPIMLRY